MRTSIATNPKVSYPAAAPYMGQSGMQRAAQTEKGSGLLAAQKPEGASQSGASGSRPLQALRDPQPSGTRVAPGGRAVEGQTDLEAIPGVDDGEGVAWQLIALAIAVLVLIAGFLVWELR